MAEEQAEKALVAYEVGGGQLSVAEVVGQMAKVQEAMKAFMKPGEHYGVIPGTQKPTLLKPGAEKLGFMFRLMPKFAIKANELANRHREYEIICTLVHQPTGKFVAEGVGNCSTMESKYRYRNESVVLEEPIPDDYRQRKPYYRSKGLAARKIDDTWRWTKFEKAENPDIADVYNTVLKMAKKRAHVDAMITACAASDIFTQDMEDLTGDDDAPAVTATATPAQRTEPAAATALCPNCKKGAPVMLSKFPEKGKWYCRDCKISFNTPGKTAIAPDEPFVDDVPGGDATEVDAASRGQREIW